MANQKTRKAPALETVNTGAAAVDIGSREHMAAVNPDVTDMPVRAFGTFTHDLHDLAAWFKSHGVTSVAMVSTGVYWIPAYEILEQHGFEVILVNARYAKNVPGRKTDVSDASWLRQLHSYGLLRGSFRPTAQIATLRAYLRQRGRLTDITYIRTHEGWSYLSVVIDLFSRRVVGWSMQSRMTTDLALQALLSAVWRRKPKTKVMIHSDQGSQFSSKEWQSFLGKHNLDASMSRRGNRHDNAVAEGFFQLLKRERIRRRTYVTRNAARQDVFDYIEMFYNPNRKHTNNGMLSPVDYEIKQPKTNEAGV
jgi:transposase InsO family protein